MQSHYYNDDILTEASTLLALGKTVKCSTVEPKIGFNGGCKIYIEIYSL